MEPDKSRSWQSNHIKNTAGFTETNRCSNQLMLSMEVFNQFWESKQNLTLWNTNEKQLDRQFTCVCVWNSSRAPWRMIGSITWHHSWNGPPSPTNRNLLDLLSSPNHLFIIIAWAIHVIHAGCDRRKASRWTLVGSSKDKSWLPISESSSTLQGLQDMGVSKNRGGPP